MNLHRLLIAFFTLGLTAASAATPPTAAEIIAYQTPIGGWPKGSDFTRPPKRPPADKDATLDNKGTTEPMAALARILTDAQSASPATPPDPAILASFDRGLDYLFAAQLPSGGWPQSFPLRKGYYSNITFNDDAMIRVLELLHDVSLGRPPYAFTSPAQRSRAAAAVERGIACILLTQVRQNGVLTAWCAQHDPVTLAPAWARNFEPPSLSGHESVGIVRFLKSLENPSPEVLASIAAAVAWFDRVRITGHRYDRYVAEDGEADRRLLADPAAPPLWARFYELGTDRPLFVGRDKVFRYALAEIERERRAGYAYYTVAPAQLFKGL